MDAKFGRRKNDVKIETFKKRSVKEEIVEYLWRYNPGKGERGERLLERGQNIKVGHNLIVR